MGFRAVTLALSITAAVGVASACLASPNGGAKTVRSGDMALTVAVASPMRSPQNVARDVYRHPQQSLSFWGLKPGMAMTARPLVDYPADWKPLPQRLVPVLRRAEDVRAGELHRAVPHAVDRVRSERRRATERHHRLLIAPPSTGTIAPVT